MTEDSKCQEYLGLVSKLAVYDLVGKTKSMDYYAVRDHIAANPLTSDEIAHLVILGHELLARLEADRKNGEGD